MPIEFLCARCMEPCELNEEQVWVHEDPELDKDHNVKPIRKTECC